MKLDDIKVGMKVFDRWWPWRSGFVKKVLKTRIYVYMGPEDLVRYDRAHCQFLEKRVK